jgi:hypothetical protein
VEEDMTAYDGLLTWRHGETTVTINTEDPITLTGRQAAQLSGTLMEMPDGGVDAAFPLGQLGCMAVMTAVPPKSGDQDA